MNPRTRIKGTKPGVGLGTVVIEGVVEELSDWDIEVGVFAESVSLGSVSDDGENREEGISSYRRKEPVSLRIKVTPKVGK